MEPQLVTTAAVAALALAGLGVVVVRTARLPSRRAPWVLFALGAAVLVTYQLSLLALAPITDSRVELTMAREHPWWAVATLAASGPLYAGLMALQRERLRKVAVGAWIDGPMIGLVLMAVCSVVILPVADARFGLGAAGAASFAGRLVLDVVLVAVAVATWMLSSSQLDRRLPLVATSFLALLLGDGLGVLGAFSVVSGSWVQLLAQGARLVGLGVLAVATVSAVHPPQDRDEDRFVQLLAPSLVLVLCVVVLAVDQAHPIGAVAVGLTLAAVVGVGVKMWALFIEIFRLTGSRVQATTDDLTGLANRRAMTWALEATELPPSGPVGLVVVDLDRFKQVNDRHGHPIGDLFLVEVAARLRRATPAGSVVARLGGDEFAVLLTGDAVGEVEAVVARVVAALTTDVLVRPTAQGQLRLGSGASVGFVVSRSGPPTGGGTGADELLRRADLALYRAKDSGGGARGFDAELDVADRARRALLDELRAVVASMSRGEPSPHGELTAWYQPQVDTRTGATVGMEALVRWEHPSRGVLTPDAFVPMVEEDGLMVVLTSFVLRAAVTNAVRWRADGHPVTVSVNVSSSCLGDPELLELLHDVLTSTGLPPAALTLEVTETMFMADPERALSSAAAIRALGIGLSIDDYGTGYASLAYLHELPATELKLDRSFTGRVLTSRRTAAIISGTIELAHRLGLTVVAEGVEDEATLHALRTLGSDVSQGFLHSRPMPAADVAGWMCATREGHPTATRSDTLAPVGPLAGATTHPPGSPGPRAAQP